MVKTKKCTMYTQNKEGKGNSMSPLQGPSTCWLAFSLRFTSCLHDLSTAGECFSKSCCLVTQFTDPLYPYLGHCMEILQQHFSPSSFSVHERPSADQRSQICKSKQLARSDLTPDYTNRLSAG